MKAINYPRLQTEVLIEKEFLLEQNLSDEELFQSDSLNKILTAELPDLRSIGRELFDSFYQSNASFNALQFVEALSNFNLSESDLKLVINNEQTNHVLIQNALLKVVLIHWPAGKKSGIHGHPKGGCVFKVLNGDLVEGRYSPDTRALHLADCYYRTGGIGYIDDSLAYHAVGNMEASSAVSIHAYTPGL